MLCSYLHVARRLSDLYHKKPIRPNDRLIGWINFVLQEGPLEEFKTEFLRLHWFEYANLDVLFLCFIIIIVSAKALLFLSKMLRKLFKSAAGRKVEMKVKRS